MAQPTGAFVLAMSLVLASCVGDRESVTSTTDTVTTTSRLSSFVPTSLIHPYSCGFMVSRGDPVGAVRLSIHVEADRTNGLTPGMSTVGRVPDGEWGGAVIFGFDLFAYWCQDVIGPPPRATETERWEIVDGTVDIVSLTPGERRDCEAQLLASGLVARTSDGTLMEVGDFELFNGHWGAFPGAYGSVFPCWAPKDAPFGVWGLVDIDGQPALANPSVTFSLSPDLVARVADESGQVRPDLFGLNGHTGCNSFSGAFDVEGDGLVVDIDSMTFRGCGAVDDAQAPQLMSEQELQFTRVLGNATTWAIDGDQLTITSQDGEIATFHEETGDTLVGVWRLSELDGQPPLEAGRDLSVTFFPGGTRLGGWAGCNSLAGTYNANADQLTTVSTVTNRECREDQRDQGQRFIAILQEADSWRIGEKQLTITSDTAGVIVLSRARAS